ncbi:hypothetical protein SAMN05216456_2629 [Devosia crocina]|uniref:DUF6460 domain-containing protein n=1 Tax=Devosia crocina TaxID=429728 RepID=A0A1I7NPM1_9HYPH|nr:DUF6460 domain-containing protein [Devosia crocina]SFV36637.1 hypothetical protein SAMN05216456_2629 [Devosia crocina]
MSEDSRPASRSMLERILGDRPVALLVKLALISLLVGVIMAIFGFDAADLVRGAVDAIHDAFRDGAGVFRQIAEYTLAGAALVVPIWLVLRLLRGR